MLYFLYFILSAFVNFQKDAIWRLFELVPRAGLEPARLLRSEDFKSSVSTIPPSGQYEFSLSEARVGIEPTYKSFADSCLTTWPPSQRIH
ncbi:MAG: hypothetical protein UT41_C0001G0398 [Candidatus Wolfebacteria bacterium GW2011_GWC2_39_22]|uniref:Uncharacterized protein n=1 Tax=Candidatus Wolfebacteria bacterium GW2011_GWC2_39_22 TaxID=1619013 RepID=A0A0G0N9J9_9BACT|nr:MAG: hypothetical protein UT41_C0001G0398 [Candidatus Wolfebacteria bacterium GW2011_GWC2_39_22]